MTKIRQDGGCRVRSLWSNTGVWLAGALAAVAIAPAHPQTAKEVVMHSFGSPQRGEFPRGNLIRDAAGNLLWDH
jgi:hypothetical protein